MVVISLSVPMLWHIHRVMMVMADYTIRFSQSSFIALDGLFRLTCCSSTQHQTPQQLSTQIVHTIPGGRGSSIRDARYVMEGINIGSNSHAISTNPHCHSEEFHLWLVQHSLREYEAAIVNRRDPSGTVASQLISTMQGKRRPPAAGSLPVKQTARNRRDWPSSLPQARTKSMLKPPPYSMY